MITDKDDSRSHTGSDNEGRDGRSSSTNRSNSANTPGLVKKKRPRVGEVRSISRDSNSAGSSDRRPAYNNETRNPYSSSNSDRRSSYDNSASNRDDRASSDRPSYNSDRRSSYGNSGGGERRSSYGNSNSGGDRRSSYGNSSNSYGGGDRRSSYNNDRRQGGNSRPSYNNRDNQRSADPNQKVIERTKRLNKPVKYKENLDPSTPLRLNKYLANAGVCSRREADTHIAAGLIKVNGVVVSELGAKVTRGDQVQFQDKLVSLESKVYVLLNKPKNTVTTSDDPQDRKTVMDLVKNACKERIYPVGRLDRNTTGVLLLTNDGDLASKLMHPKFKKKKIYQVTLDRDVAIEDMQAIADGITLDDGEIHADSIAYVAEDVLNEVGIEIHSGRNRIVRRIFEKLGYQVTKLDRVYFSGLTKKNLSRGQWRYLTETEVNMLRMGSFQ